METRDSFVFQQIDNLAYILCKCSLPEPHKTTLRSLHRKLCQENNSHKRTKNTKFELQQQLSALTYVSKKHTLPVFHKKPLQDLLAEITKEINSKNKENKL